MPGYKIHIGFISFLCIPFLTICADNKDKKHNLSSIINIDLFNTLKTISKQLNHNTDQFEKDIQMNYGALLNYGAPFTYPGHNRLKQYWHRNIKAKNQLKRL